MNWQNWNKMSMKYASIIFISLFLYSQNWVLAQGIHENKVPKPVRDSFKAKYPSIYVYEWEWKKKEKIYEAEFIIKGNKYEAEFSESGEWLKTERDLHKDEVPQLVWESLSKTPHASWKIDGQEEHSTPEHEQLYEIEVKAGNRKQKLYFTPDGRLVQPKNK